MPLNCRQDTRSAWVNSNASLPVNCWYFASILKMFVFINEHLQYFLLFIYMNSFDIYNQCRQFSLENMHWLPAPLLVNSILGIFSDLHWLKRSSLPLGSVLINTAYIIIIIIICWLPPPIIIYPASSNSKSKYWSISLFGFPKAWWSVLRSEKWNIG